MGVIFPRSHSDYYYLYPLVDIGDPIPYRLMGWFAVAKCATCRSYQFGPKVFKKTQCTGVADKTHTALRIRSKTNCAHETTFTDVTLCLDISRYDTFRPELKLFEEVGIAAVAREFV